MKKVYSLIISLAIILTISVPCIASSAEEQAGDKKDTTAEQKSDIKDLTIEDAYKYIESNNNELKLMDDKIKLYEKQYNSAVDRSNWARGRSIGNDEDKTVELRKEELLYPKQDLLTLNNAKHDREELLNSLKRDVKNQILSILALKQDMENTQNEIANLDKTINQTKSQIDLGTLNKSSLKSLESQKVQLQSQLTKTERQIDLNYISLKRDLGIKLDQEVTLAPYNAEFVKFDDTDIEKRIQNAIENSYDYKKQQDDLELSKIEYEIINNYTSVDNNLVQIKQLQNDISDKQAALEDIKPTLEADLWTKYNALKNAEDDINIEKINLADAEYELSITKAKVEAGTAKSIDEINDMQTVNEEKNKVQKAINAYLVAVDEMKYLLGEQTEKGN